MSLIKNLPKHFTSQTTSIFFNVSILSLCKNDLTVGVNRKLSQTVKINQVKCQTMKANQHIYLYKYCILNFMANNLYLQIFMLQILYALINLRMCNKPLFIFEISNFLQ